MSKGHYYRVVNISMVLFEQWLHLPRGFTMDNAQYNFENNCIQLRVACPKNPKYEVKVGDQIPISIPLAKITAKGRMRVWHPDLGQKEDK